MNLINEVLNQLEQRGVQTAPNQSQVRAVAVRREGLHIRYAGFGVVGLLCLVLFIGVWFLRQSQQTDAVQSQPIQSVQAALSVQSDAEQAPASKLSYELSVLPSERESSAEGKSKPFTKAVTPAPVQAAQPLSPPARPLIESMATSSAPPLKQVSQVQRADAEFRKAAAVQQQGRALEAMAGYEAALKLDPQHEAARLALAAQLSSQRRAADAERVLREGLHLRPSHQGFIMALARAQVDQENINGALATLQQNLPKADNKPDYQAFYAALLQRQGRHKEAINHYQIATRLVPSDGVWLMGYGISLQAVQRNEDAKAAYQQALATQTLTPALAAFVEQKLKGL